MLAEPGEDRDDARVAPTEEMAEEDGLELERVLALVIELVGVRIEITSAGDLVDRCEVALDRAERRREAFTTERKWLTHRRVRRSEQHERVGARGKCVLERSVRVPVAERAAPWIDVRSDEADEPVAVRFVAVRPARAEAVAIDVICKLARIAVVRAAGV